MAPSGVNLHLDGSLCGCAGRLLLFALLLLAQLFLLQRRESRVDVHLSVHLLRLAEVLLQSTEQQLVAFLFMFKAL